MPTDPGQSSLHSTSVTRPHAGRSPRPNSPEERLLPSWLSVNAILWLAGAARLGTLLLVHNFLQPNFFEFGTIARNYLAGKGFSYFMVQGVDVPTAYMPPGYSWLLIALFSIFGDRPGTYIFLQIVQAASGVLLVYVVYRFTWLAWDEDTALVAALLSAVYPPFLYIPAEMHSINFYIVLLLGVTYYLFLLLEMRPRASYAVWAALLLGVLIYFRAEMLALLFIFAALVLWQSRRQWCNAAVLILLPLAMLVPWAWRNYQVFGRPVLTTTAGGINLWYGHNRQANGTQRIAWPSGQVVLPDVLLQQKIDAIPPTSEYELQLSGVYRSEAFQFARANIRREIQLAFNKLTYFWTIDWNHPKARNLLYAGPTMALTALFWIGALVERRRLLGRYRVLVLLLLFTNCVAVVFFVLPRYRLAIDPFLIPFAASALLWMLRARPVRIGQKVHAECREDQRLASVIS